MYKDKYLDWALESLDILETSTADVKKILKDPTNNKDIFFKLKKENPSIFGDKSFKEISLFIKETYNMILEDK